MWYYKNSKRKMTLALLYIQCWQAALRTTLNPQSNFDQNANPGTVLNSAHHEDSWNTPNMLKLIKFWQSYLRSKTNDIILKTSSKVIQLTEFSFEINFLSQKLLCSFGDIPKERKNIFEMPVRCLGCLISWFWVKMSRILEISS